MNPKVLIIEELHEGKFSSFNGYAACCDIFGYKFHICHDLEQLSQIMEEFIPDVVFWINTVSDEIDKLRLQYKHLKVVVAYDWEIRFVGEDPNVDIYLHQCASIVPNKFQKIITELFFTSSTNNIEQRSLRQLSDNALREVVAEQMWPGEMSRLQNLMERNQRGDLDENGRRTLKKLILVQEQLLQRKVEAASILIDRGYSGSVEELIEESKRLD